MAGRVETKMVYAGNWGVSFPNDWQAGDSQEFVSVSLRPHQSLAVETIRLCRSRGRISTTRRRRLFSLGLSKEISRNRRAVVVFRWCFEPC